MKEIERANLMKLAETKKKLDQKLNETNERCMTQHMKIIQKIAALQQRFKTQLPK